MNIVSRMQNRSGKISVEFQTGTRTHSINAPAKSSGFGSDVNGGEFLFLAMAACYCNDLYREAAKRKIEISDVEVEVKGEFDTDGLPAGKVHIMLKSAHMQIKESF